MPPFENQKAFEDFVTSLVPGAAGIIGTDPGTGNPAVGAGTVPLLSSVVTGSSTDPAGRTQVLGTSTIKAPALRQFVYVDDVPFGAAGDAHRVTDGAMTSGSNSVSSATATFVVGQVVEVIGAGPQPGGRAFGNQPNLSGYVKTVVGTAATLVTTAGGSTPVNASTTVSGAIVTYGTDDTASVHAASSAVTAAGGGTVGFTPFKAYWFSSLVPTSNVTYSAPGAVLYVLLPPAVQQYPNPAIYLDQANGVGTSGVSNITFRSMNWVGHGTEYHFQGPIYMVGAVNVRTYDCTFSNFPMAGSWFEDVTGVRVVNCDYINCCAINAAGSPQNPVEFVTGILGSTYPLTDLLISGNRVSGGIGEGIDVSTVDYAGLANSTTPFRAIITGNTVLLGAGTGSNAAITIELGGPTINGAPVIPAEKVVIANNTCTNGVISAAVDAGTPTTNQTLIERFIVSGNEVDTTSTTNFGIDFRGSYGVVTGNVVKGSFGINVQAPSTAGTITATGNVTSASASVTITAGGTGVLNGTPVAGTGIVTGAFLKSGAGTGTWVLSDNATATNTGVTITAQPQATGINVTGNNVHCLGTGTTPVGIQATAVRNSTIAGNIITFNSGSTAGYGVNVFRCGWVRVRNNDIDYPPNYGIYAQVSNDITIQGNGVYNGWSANWLGVRLNNLTGANNLVMHNEFVDDKATPTMYNAVQTGGSCENVRILRNLWIGWTNAPVDNLTGVVNLQGNLPESHTFPADIAAISVGTSPYIYTNSNPYPVQVVIGGGTLSSCQLAHSGGSYHALGITGGGGSVLMRPGDLLYVAYSSIPTMTAVAM